MSENETNSNVGLIYSAMVAVMNDINAIGKDRKNTQQNFAYRGIDDVYNVLHPVMCQHGVFSVPEVLEERREERETRNGGAITYTVLRIRYTFYAVDGSSVQATVIGEAMDAGDKSANKAMSVAHKYAMFQAFCIPTRDLDDPDAHSYEVQPRGIDVRQPARRTEPEQPRQSRPQAPAQPDGGAPHPNTCVGCGSIVPEGEAQKCRDSSIPVSHPRCRSGVRAPISGGVA